MIRKIAVFVLLAVLAAGAYWQYRLRHPMRLARNVFINATADHRFDESIRVSILAAQDRSGVQNAVVIAQEVPKDFTVESWAPVLFQSLNVGREANGRGVLYLFVPSQNALKIEVSYPLEAVLPDLELRALERAAKTFTFAGRYQDFWAELLNTVNMRIQRGKNDLPESDLSKWTYLSGGAGVTGEDYAVTSQQLESELNAKGEGDADFTPGATPAITLQRYLKSLGQGIGSANLPLLSASSRLFRTHTPLTAANLERNRRMYEQAGEPIFERQRSVAIAVFLRGAPVLPIYFIQDPAGQWLVNEPASWGHFHRFENSNDVFVKFRDEKFQVAMSRANFAGKTLYPGAPPAKTFVDLDVDLIPKLAELERAVLEKPEARSQFELGDFYLFELYMPEAALAHYEEALKLEPENLQYLWREIDPLINLGRYSDALKIYEKLAASAPADKDLQRDYDYLKAVYTFNPSEWQTKF